MTSATSYASPEDLEDRWRPLATAQERRLAATLLAAASRKIRARPWNVDGRIETGELDPESVTDVVCFMVKRAMLPGGGAEGVTQESQTAGPYQTSVTYGNPMGNLYFSADDLTVLSGGKARKAFAVDLTPVPPVVP